MKFILLKPGLLGLVSVLILVQLVGCSKETSPMQAKSLHRYTTASVLSADLSKDGEMVALLTADQQVGVWDNRHQKQLHTWGVAQLGDEVKHLALSGNKQRLCVAGYWTVTMLDTNDGSVVTAWDVQGFVASATVSALHVDHSGGKVLVGMSDGAVLSVNLTTGDALKLDLHNNQITRLAYVHNTNNINYAVSGSTDKNLAYWRTDNAEVVYQHKFRSRVTTLAVDPEFNKLFVSDSLTTQWILDSRSGEKLAELNYFERFRYFRQGYFVEQGKYLITSSPKDVMTLWDTRSGEERISWQIKRFTASATVLAMAKNAADELVTLSSDGAVQVWDYRQFL